MGFITREHAPLLFFTCVVLSPRLAPNWRGRRASPPALLHGWKKDKSLTPSPSPNWRGEFSEHLSPLHSWRGFG